MTRVAATPPPTIVRADTDAFAELIEQRFGHQPEEHRMIDLAALLEARLRRTRSAGWEGYRRLLERSDLHAQAEWEELAPLLTVPETYFFRLPDHLEALAADALPKLLAAKAGSRRLRLLSAGCATGEEPYTLRILLNERFPELATWQVEIVGVDLSAQALERARLGVYSSWSLRATSPERQQRNFTAAGKQFRLKPQARAGVELRRENLLAPPPAGEPAFDVIFCRNVLIYFSPVAMLEAIARLTERLAPGGFLFLGPAESLRGLSLDFDLCHAQDTFFYRRKTEAERAAAEPVGEPEPPAPGTPLPARGKAVASPGPRQPRRAAADTAAPPGLAALVKAERFAEGLALLEAEGKAAEPGAVPVDAARPLLRAALLTNLGRYAEAEAECRGLLAHAERNPTERNAAARDAAAHYLLGLCREQAGALAEAGEQMSRSIALDPGFAMAHLHRGLLARRRQQPAAAAAALQLALEAIAEEDLERLALFGGGFSREALRALCLRELGRLGGRAGAA